MWRVYWSARHERGTKDKSESPKRNRTQDLPNTELRELIESKVINWVNSWQVSCILLGSALWKSSWVFPAVTMNFTVLCLIPASSWRFFISLKILLITTDFPFQLRISGRNEIEVLVNGNLMEFDEQFVMDFVGVIILKYRNSSRYSIIFDSGISVTIEKVEGILQMQLLVPPVFKGGFAISLLSMFSFS